MFTYCFLPTIEYGRIQSTVYVNILARASAPNDADNHICTKNNNNPFG